MIGETKYYLGLVSKNIFSAALPFYRLHFFMAYKPKYYCAAKQLQKEDSAMDDFFQIQFLFNNSFHICINDEPGYYFIVHILLIVLN